MMKPKSGDREQPGLLEYLEEVIGTMQLKEIMDEKSSEIEKLEEKRYEYGERVTLARSKLLNNLCIFRHT
jgi:structural maintenance of chromosome 4